MPCSRPHGRHRSVKSYRGRYQTTVTFYCDPPYTHDTRGDIKAYKYEMDVAAHTELADVLNSIRGKAAVSGYNSPLMDQLYKGWHKIVGPIKNVSSVQQLRQEILWVNYDLSKTTAWETQPTFLN